MTISITIGIPTFNRREYVTELLRSLQNSKLPACVKILISDNGSSDGTFEELKKMCVPGLSRIIGNKENIGFGGNFFRLLNECETDYLLLTSDEDEVITGNLEEYIKFLSDKQPGFSSPITMRGEKIHMGRQDTRPIAPKEFRSSSFYVSGLTFNVAKSSHSAKVIEHNCKSLSVTHLYPQVLLAGHLICEGSAIWWGKPISNMKHISKSHITTPSGGKHYHLSARWAQYQEFIDYFSEAADKAEDEATADRFRNLVDDYSKELTRVIAKGIKMERPDLACHFNSQPAPSSKQLVKELVKRLLPSSIAKALRRTSNFRRQ